MNISTLLRYLIQNLNKLCDIGRVIELNFLIISLSRAGVLYDRLIVENSIALGAILSASKNWTPWISGSGRGTLQNAECRTPNDSEVW